MGIYHSAAQLVGHTPLLAVDNYAAARGLPAVILAKLESFNPAGSAKDRVALEMLRQAEASGVLQPGGTVIEPTSGNTGIGLAAMAISKGYRVILTMPASMSAERRALLKAYGAELVLVEEGGMAGAVAKAEELAAAIPGSFIPGQFDNPANPAAHYKTTGPEIWQDTEGHVDIFVAGVGTGGTISGTGRYLKEQDPHVRVVAVEPASSPLLSQGHAGPHGLQGIGANFVPKTMTPLWWMRSSLSPTRKPTAPAACWPVPRASWRALPPARPCGPPMCWPAARKMRARPSWRCCRTMAAATCPHPFGRRNKPCTKITSAPRPRLWPRP